MNEQVKYIQCWSGGKDSTASIILEHMHNLPRSEIVFVEIMFDKEKGISADYPEQQAWIHNYAIPIFESWGHKVTVLRSDKDYKDSFFHKVVRSKYPERVGKYRGFPIARLCAIKKDMKETVLARFFRCQKEDVVQIVGIAADEQRRLESINKKPGHISLLEKYGYTEEMCFNLCKEYNLLSPIYSNGLMRGGAGSVQQPKSQSLPC